MTRKSPPPPPPVRKAEAAPAAPKGRWVNYQIPGIDVPLKRWNGTRPAIYDAETAKRLGVRVDGVPVEDPHYLFREEMVRELAWAIWPHDGAAPTPSLLAGPKSSGKTSLVWQLANRCNVVVHRINLNVGTTVRQLKGKTGVRAKNGASETRLVRGVATRAMEDGTWLLLDELSACTPPVAMCLFPILEFDPPGAVMLEDAEPVRYALRHPDFRVFATDNTIGAEQEDSRFNYGGTNPDMNDALMDRIMSFVQVGYMTREQEFETVKSRVPDIDDNVLEGMVRVAHNVRESGEVATGFSHRMLHQWARRYAAGTARVRGATPHSYQAVLDLAGPAFLNKMRSRVERDAIAEVIRRVYRLGGGGVS